jgi:Protein of unknown function (DUF3829)
MTSIRALALVIGAAVLLSPLAGRQSVAQVPALTEKVNAATDCINRLSERSHLSRHRYFSWASKEGPTGKERIIYGTYTIYDTSDCKKKIEKAIALEPHEAEFEAAASAYVEAVVALEPLLKDADEYYTQENYKDDGMAKGKALHPRLVAAWDAFTKADEKLRADLDVLQDKDSARRLAEIEKTEGIKDRYHIEAVMISAKRLMRANKATPPDLDSIVEALNGYEAILKATEEYADANKGAKIGSSFVNDAKSFLATGKQLMRRIRDKVPYSQGDRMILNTGSGGWMIEGSLPRLTRDYNQLIGSYNRGARF